jgi:hypothetical protein
MGIENRRAITAYSLPAALIEVVKELADAEYGGNRSAAAEAIMVRGLPSEERRTLPGEATKTA